jgi:acetolactate synthase-1/2/3 large subunit
MKNYLDGGDAILEAFRNLDIDYVLSSPGSEWGSVWEAFTRQQVEKEDGPTYLSCWHETLAVNVAAGYSAATGRMQAVMLHAGVGLLQGSNGIHGAMISEVPMLVVSGESLTYGEDENFDPGHQWIGGLSVVGGPNRLLEPVTKWSNQATSAATLYESVVRTGEMARRTPAGPTYLSIPIETMLQEWARPDGLRMEPTPTRPRASAAEIERIAKMLIEAKHPVIVTETIGRDAAGFDALVALAELLSIPVVEGGLADYSNLPKNHPLHQGSDIGPHFEAADLVLTVRCRVPWYPPSKRPPNATIVAIDEVPYKGHMVYQSLHADAFLEGDAVASLEMLAEAVRASGVDAARVAEQGARWQAAHDELHAGLRAKEAEARGKSPIDPIWLCAALGESLPDNAVFVDETITHRGVVRTHVPWNGKHDFFRVSGGLGQGLGMALGVKLALKDRPVVSLIGDGSFLYNPVTQSLGFSLQEDLPILIVVFNNNGYLAMKRNHLQYYPDGVAKQNDIYIGETINGPEYAELTAPFGGHGIRVDDPAKLPGAIAEGLAAVEDGRTTILNVILSH